MKKTLLLFLLFSFFMFYYSCAKDSNGSNVTSGEFEAEIQWLFLVSSGNEAVKEDVRLALKDEFDWVLKMSELENKVVDVNKIPIALTLFDLNHDGKDEIIAFVSNIEFQGANDSGALYVIGYMENGFKAKCIAGFPLDISTLDNPKSKQVGVINNGKEWDDLIINSVDLAVSGLHWDTNVSK